MKINKLQKKGKKVLITFEDGNEINVFYEIIVKYGLRKQDEIDEAIKNKLISENEIVKIKNSSFRYLTLRDHSVYELKNKLLKKNYSKTFVLQVLEELKEKNYLNDERFTEKFIREKLYQKKFGINKIKAELFRKGIDRKTIEKMLILKTNDEIFYANAKMIAQKKCSILKERKIVTNKIKPKVINFLLSKGYEGSLINKVINELNI